MITKRAIPTTIAMIIQISCAVNSPPPASEAVITSEELWAAATIPAVAENNIMATKSILKSFTYNHPLSS